MPETSESQTKLVIRQSVGYQWVWVLMTSDSHVVNRSDSQFASRAACLEDAQRNGLSLND